MYSMQGKRNKGSPASLPVVPPALGHEFGQRPATSAIIRAKPVTLPADHTRAGRDNDPALDRAPGVLEAARHFRKVAAYGAILPLIAAQRVPDAAIKWLAPS